MTTTLKDIVDRLPAERRQRVEARAQELIAEEMSLRELRKAMDKTQTELARKTGKSQVTLSRLERQSDMLISTLNDVVRGLGGRVRIVAELPNHPPVYLTGLTGLSTGVKRPAGNKTMPPARQRKGLPKAKASGRVTRHRTAKAM